MAFIRCRQSTREKSYQLVESYREGGKVRQRVLANLGRHATLEAAIADFRRRVALDERLLARYSDDDRIRRKGLRIGMARARYSAEKGRRRVASSLERERANLDRLERVVSEFYRRREISDTTSTEQARGPGC